MLGRRLVTVSLLAWAGGCIISPGTYPELGGTLVGESAHFRLFLDSEFDPSSFSPYGQAPLGLDALEADWADKQTMLKMPEGERKIDYHLMTREHIVAACLADVGSCELGTTLQIATDAPLFQHELIHSYMQLVAPGAEPMPLIREGTAQAIGCYGLPWRVDPMDEVPSWQEAVVSDHWEYDQGGVFARYLIRTQGIDAFVRYYRQAPGARDPALFAANFSAFWNMSIDDAWTAMHAVVRATGNDAPICPCSWPAPATDGQPLDGSLATHLYWPLPDAGNASLALTAPSGAYFDFADCEGLAPYFWSNPSFIQRTDSGKTSSTDASVAIVQLPSDGRRRYTTGPISTASVGPYIADNCGAGVPYQLPPDFVNGWGQLSILVDQASLGAVTKYVQVQLSSLGAVSLGLAPGMDVCDSCGFEQGACVASPEAGGLPFASDAIVSPGPVNLRWSVPAVLPGGEFPAPAGGWIQVTGFRAK